MSVAITALYAAISALVILVFALNVMRARGVYRVGLGDGGNPDMQRAIRVHGNAIEYVPIALIVMLLYELMHGSPLLLHISGVCLVLGRIAHAIGVLKSSGTSSGRFIGIVGAFVAIAAPSIGILVKLLTAG